MSKTYSNGKLVDTWYYEYQGIHDTDAAEVSPKDVLAKGIKVPVKLKIYKKLNPSDLPPQEVGEVWFEVECDNPKWRLKGSDIEVLRAAMWDAPKTAKVFQLKNSCH